MKTLIPFIFLFLSFNFVFGQHFKNGQFITTQKFDDEIMLSTYSNGTINRTKKFYTIIGQLNLNGANLTTTWTGIHPDSNTISTFQSLVGAGGIASLGQIFDPKSPVWYDIMTAESHAISASASYIIDTFLWSGAYFRPQLGPANDTLKIQFFLQPNMNYFPNDSSLTFNRAFCLPTYDAVLKQGINADTSVNVIFDDNSAQGEVGGIIPLGLHVPAGYELGVAYSFIPGSPYKAGDTTGVLKTNPDTLTAGNINAFWMRGAWDNGNNHHEGFYNYNFGVYKNQYDPFGLVYENSVSHYLMGFFVTYDDFTGIDNVDPTGMTIYPNPANDYVFIDNDEEGNILELLDQSGRVLQSWDLDKGINSIDLPNVSPGLYFARVNSYVQRLIIR